MTLPRRILTLAFAASMLLSTSGCILLTNSGSRGDVSFLWSFNGNVCAVVPDVTQVTITIPGQTLANSGTFACTNSGTAGITLLDFAPGSYSYTIEGRNNAGSILYQASGRFTVDGDVTVNVNLQANTTATGSIFISWTFPASGTSGGRPATCSQTIGPISSVEISIDGATGVPVSCAEGQTSPGARFDNVQAGSHTIDILAFGPDHGAPTGQSPRSLAYYRKTSTIQAVAGTSASQQFTLDWAVGGTAMKWTFSNGLTQLTCAQAGVTNVFVDLRDSQGNYFPDTTGSGVAVPCSGSGVQGTTLPSSLLSYLYAGNYQIYLQAYGTGNVLYKSSFTAPANTTVTAGVFPELNSSTQTIILNSP